MMDYRQTLHWMFARLPMYQRQGAAAFRNNLDNIHELDTHLGHPHTCYKTVHVGGTNGKGSTSHILAAILQEAGYKVGLYTSPHLRDFRERIRINGTMMPEEDVISFIGKNKKFIEEHQLSFFELTVGMAFDHFAKQKVDVAIIEVGLGGRLDATNIIIPEVAVITNIGLDHTAFLGTTLAQIAGEKAGIIKKGVPVVIGEKQPETTAVFVQTAVDKGCEIYFASGENYQDYDSDLKGSYQKQNKKTVLKTIEVLQGQGSFLIHPENIKKGIRNAGMLTGLMGRWQQLGERPTVICDTGHNREGISQVVEQLRGEHYERLHIVLGMVKDKDLDAVLPLFPKDARYYFCTPDLARGLEVAVLKVQAEHYGLMGESYTSVKMAYNAAIKAAVPEDLVFVGGSTFVVAEII